MSRHRIVTEHLVKRTALTELGRLFVIQDKGAAGDPEALAECARLQITPTTRLMIRKEDRRRFHWAVVIPV